MLTHHNRVKRVRIVRADGKRRNRQLCHATLRRGGRVPGDAPLRHHRASDCELQREKPRRHVQVLGPALFVLLLGRRRQQRRDWRRCGGGEIFAAQSQCNVPAAVGRPQPRRVQPTGGAAVEDDCCPQDRAVAGTFVVLVVPVDLCGRGLADDAASKLQGDESESRCDV
jgi:hypothetical protein